jgi:hypothetical protein
MFSTRAILFVLAAVLMAVSAFHPSANAITGGALRQQRITKSSKGSDMTMVVYWSIKSSFDLAQYAVGAKDTFKGTGVWSFVEMDRKGDAEKKELDASSKKSAKDSEAASKKK